MYASGKPHIAVLLSMPKTLQIASREGFCFLSTRSIATLIASAKFFAPLRFPIVANYASSYCLEKIAIGAFPHYGGGINAQNLSYRPVGGVYPFGRKLKSRVDNVWPAFWLLPIS